MIVLLFPCDGGHTYLVAESHHQDHILVFAVIAQKLQPKHNMITPYEQTLSEK